MKVGARLASSIFLFGFVFALFSASASAACPVSKRGGGTWCEKGWEWKCEKCGSEYCPIMTGRKCLREDPSEARQRSDAGRGELEEIVAETERTASLTIPAK